MICVPREDSDQPGHTPSLIRVFAVRMKKPWVLSYPLRAQRRLYQTGQMPRLIRVFAVRTSFCWFCRAAAQMIYIFVWNIEWFHIYHVNVTLHSSQSFTVVTICFKFMRERACVMRLSWNWCVKMLNEPAHEIMALFVLRKFILQMSMSSHPVELDVWFLVPPFVFFHTSWVQTAKALARLCGCVGSSEPSLVAYVISAMISWAGLNVQFYFSVAYSTNEIILPSKLKIYFLLSSTEILGQSHLHLHLPHVAQSTISLVTLKF